MNRPGRYAAWALFLLYCAIMFWLLFLRQRGNYLLAWAVQGGEYWEHVGWSVNLRPFYTIENFAGAMAEGGYFARHALINLAGNVAMFVPLGVLLPVLFRRQRRFWRFFLTCALLIILVEAAQALLLRGSGDIDDLILNLAGASLGYPLGRLAAGALDKGERQN